MRQAACFLPPSLSPTAPVGQPQLSSGPFPPTAAACAVSVILPSDAPPTATASLASDAPRHGFLHVLAVEPPSGPYSPPLLSAFLPRPHTARPSAALLWTSASFRPSAPTAVAGLLSWLGSVARDPSFRASPSSSSAVAALGLRILFGPADARAFSSLPREFFPPTPATSLITSPASPFLGAKRPFVAQVAVVIAA
ncbi:unnamed protein product [Closterium sp. NIES-64]|nr:unnamed protein product [Closterium sp. NIES-64]